MIGLSGPLGAGKTCLVRGLATGLAIPPDEVASPTFVLCHEYHGRFPVYHFDAYRLSGAAEFAALGVADYFCSDGVCVIEWADRVTSVLPEERLDIAFEMHDDDERTLRFTGQGNAAIELIRTISRDPRIPSACRQDG